jgi:hypothetical protein
LLSAIALYSSGRSPPSIRKPPSRSNWPERAPQSRGLDEQFEPDVGVELVVPGGVVVAHDGVGDVGVDVEGGRPRRPVAGALLAVDRAPGERGALQTSSRARSRAWAMSSAASAARPRPRAGAVWISTGSTNVLGVPEAVAVVPGPGQALGRDRALLRAGTGLQHVELREADRLLQRQIAVDLDVRAAQNSSRYPRWSASSPSHPVWIAPVRPAATWSRNAGIERCEDHP